MRLNGKKAVVTGAAGGIGRSIAVAFAREGAETCVVDIDSAGGKTVAAGIRAAGGRAFSVACDVGVPGEVSAMAGAVLQRWDAPDIVVNNAGVLNHVLFQDMTFAQWRRTMATNLDSMFLVSGAFVGSMVASGRGGRIINAASVLSIRAADRYIDYASSKGGVEQFTKVLAMELGPHKITVNAFAPGPTNTALNDGVYTPEVVAKLTSRMALGRIAEPDEIAPAVVFLASDEAGFITGATLMIDGGYTLY